MKKTILIVEDEQPLLEALVQKFIYEGFSTLQAKNGKEGLAIALDNHPDIILADIMMPEMDGMTMAELLRKDDWGKKVPIIFLTNADSYGKRLKKLIKIGAAYYLIKSQWGLDQIVAKVKELLGINE